MPRRSTGTVIPPDGDRQKSWAIRFNDQTGKRRFLTLGRPEDGLNRQRAEVELRRVISEVERGIWTPELPRESTEPSAEPDFHSFAEEWMALREPELRPGTISDYRWCLECHLLAHFGTMPLSSIDARSVDTYAAAKLREGKIGPNQVNKTLVRLAQILDLAVDYGLLAANPAKGRKRRIRGTKPKRTWVEPEQIPALIDVADPYLRPIIATMAGAGLRVGEAVALCWRDVNLSTGTLHVRESKTAAGEDREVDLAVGVVEELATWKARSLRTQPTDPVFVSRPRNGISARQTKRNVEARLKGAIALANEALENLDIERIDPSTTPHSLRRTFASLRYANGDDPIYVAEQGGWSNPAFPMKVYAKAVRRRDRLDDVHRQQFDRAMEWARIASGGVREEVPGANMPSSSASASELDSASQSRKSATPGV